MMFVYHEFETTFCIHGDDKLEQLFDVCMFKLSYLTYYWSLVTLNKAQFWVWSSLPDERPVNTYIFDVKF